MPRNNGAKTSPAKIQAAERQRKALQLRKAGATYDEIAASLGYRSRSAAYGAVDRAITALTKEPAEAVRALEMERLDAMLAGLWDDAKAGDTAAVSTVLRLMERRARLLGLDADPDVQIGASAGVVFQIAEATPPGQIDAKRTVDPSQRITAGDVKNAIAETSGRTNPDVVADGQPDGHNAAGNLHQTAESTTQSEGTDHD